MRQVPPLQAIEAFVTAARSRSFREAADRLALSPSATLRRIQALEAYIGRPLFDRGAKPLRLSEAGVQYLAAIEPAVLAITEATARSRRPAPRPQLRLAVSQSLAAHWLMPRLESMSVATGLELELVIGAGLHAMSGGQADLAVNGATRAPEGLHASPLIDLDAIAVCGPRLGDCADMPRDLGELCQRPRLDVTEPAHLWKRWLARLGRRDDGPAPKPFATQSLAYEAAASGLGFALGAAIVGNRYLRDGRLRRCLDARAPLGAGYRLICRDAAAAGRADIRRLRDWLKAEMEASQREFDRLASLA